MRSNYENTSRIILMSVLLEFEPKNVNGDIYIYIWYGVCIESKNVAMIVLIIFVVNDVEISYSLVNC